MTNSSSFLNQWLSLASTNADRTSKVEVINLDLVAVTLRPRTWEDEQKQVHEFISGWAYIGGEKSRVTFWKPMQVAAIPTLENKGKLVAKAIRIADWEQADGTKVPCYNVVRLGDGPALTEGWEILAGLAQTMDDRAKMTTWVNARVFKGSVYHSSKFELFTMFAVVESAQKDGIFKPGERIRIVAGYADLKHLRNQEQGPATGQYHGALVLRRMEKRWEVRDDKKMVVETVAQARLVAGAFADDYESAMTAAQSRPAAPAPSPEQDPQF